MGRKKRRKKNFNNHSNKQGNKTTLPEKTPIKKKGTRMDVLIYGLGGLAGILFVVFGVLYSSHAQKSIWFLFFPGGVLVLFTICLVWHRTVSVDIDNPPFSVEIETAITGATRDTGHWLAECNPNTLCPIPLTLFMSVENLQSVPADINELRIEIQKTKRRWIFPLTWIKGTNIPDYMPLVSLGVPPSQSLRVGLDGTRLPTRLGSGPLQSHETARGWILLDMPASYDEAVSPIVYRITVKDTAGRKFTKMDSPESNGNNVGPKRGIRFFPGYIDLSNYKIQHLADTSKSN